MTVSVLWNLHRGSRDTKPNEVIAIDLETLLPPWAAISVNAEQVASAIATDYFSDMRQWTKLMGVEEDKAWVKVTIWAPTDVAGVFEVELSRIIAGMAKRLKLT